jgi:hypothetical protein
VALMAAVLILSLVLWVLLALHGRCVRGASGTAAGGLKPPIRFSNSVFCQLSANVPELLVHACVTACFGLLSLLYAPAANTVFSLLACSQIDVSAIAYGTLDRDVTAAGTARIAAALAGSETSTVAVSVLTSNPSFVCYEGSHRPAGVLAWVTLLLVTVGYPLWTLVWAWPRIRRTAQAALQREFQSMAVCPGAAVLHRHAADSRRQSDVLAASGATAWQILGLLDATALASALRERRVRGTAALLCCGRERLIRESHGCRWLCRRSLGGAGASGKLVGRRMSGDTSGRDEALGVAAVRAVSRRSLLHTAAAAPTDSGGSKRAPTAAPSRRRPSVVLSTTATAQGRRSASPAELKAAPSGAPGSDGPFAIPPSGVPPALAPRRSAGAYAVLESAAPPIPGVLQLEACNTCIDVLTDDSLRSFVGTSYRASAFYGQQVDMLAVALLAALQWFWQLPQTAAAVTGRCCLYVAALLFTAWVIVTRNPFWPHDAWKLYVKVGSLLLAALAAVLMHFSLFIDVAYGVPPDPSQPGYEARARARIALSYAVCVGCVLLIAVLAIGFWWSSIVGAAAEKRWQRASAVARAQFVRAAADASGGELVPLQLVKQTLHAGAPAAAVGHDAATRALASLRPKHRSGGFGAVNPLAAERSVHRMSLAPAAVGARGPVHKTAVPADARPHESDPHRSMDRLSAVADESTASPHRLQGSRGSMAPRGSHTEASPSARPSASASPLEAVSSARSARGHRASNTRVALWQIHSTYFRVPSAHSLGSREAAAGQAAGAGTTSSRQRNNIVASTTPRQSLPGSNWSTTRHAGALPTANDASDSDGGSADSSFAPAVGHATAAAGYATPRLTMVPTRTPGADRRASRVRPASEHD